MTDKQGQVVRIILVGDSAVGKTSILQQYITKSFNINSTVTTGIDFQNKNLNIDGKDIKLQIWDTAGQECFRSLGRQYYRRADGIVLCFDLTSKTSFQALQGWLESITENAVDNIPVVLIGNKIDLAIIVSKDQAQEFANDTNLRIFFTSAKTGENINEAFDYIAKKALNIAKDSEVTNTPVEIKESEKKKGCC